MRVPPAFAIAAAAAFAFLAAVRTTAQFQAPRDQPAPAAQVTARLGGRVIAGDSGKPVRNAMVTLSLVGGRAGLAVAPRSASTDADGRWEIRDLAPADYQVEVMKAGFVTTRYGRRRPFGPGKVITVRGGQVLNTIDVTVPAGGVISGRVFDEFGEPVNSVLLVALRPRYVDGERQLLPAIGNEMAALVQGGLADDLGQFRIHGLPAGLYYLSAQASGPFGAGRSGQQETAYVSTYYPGTAVPANAAPVVVEEGHEVNATFNLTRVRVVSVSGGVTSASGRAASGGQVWLTPTGSSSSMGENISADGAFSFSSVAPGEYVVTVQTNTGRGRPGGPGQQPSEFGVLPVSVSNVDLGQLAIQTTPAVTASGRVVIEDGTLADLEASGPMFIRAPSAGPGAARFRLFGNDARIRTDLTFEILNLIGRQFLRLYAPPPIDRSGMGTGAPPLAAPTWFVTSVRIAGVDVTDSGYEFGAENVQGIEIVLTRQVGGLTAAVTDERAAPVTDYSLIAFSTDERRWAPATRFVRAVDSKDDGTADIKGLPPGDYFVIAVPLVEPGQETDSDQLRAWSAKATRVTLGSDETKQLALKLSR